MGYLDNSTVTVDAILTNKGRQILAAGGRLNITKFALSDDEIDYTLWNPSHTLGTNYYGAVIESMPVVEANPDEAQMMRYKLITLPKDVMGIPVISVDPGSISFLSTKQSATVTPTTLNLDGANTALGYTAILSDDSVATLEVAPAGVIKGVSNSLLAGAGTMSATSFLDDEVNGISSVGSTVTRVGTQFIVRAKSTSTPGSALLTIIGNETGGFKTINISSAANISTFSDIQPTR